MPIPKNHFTSARLTAKEHVFNQVQQWIIDGTLLAGEKINDIELAEALGVSRTPVREALQILEMEGFVKMFPGKATQVTEIERESIHDLLPPLASLQVLAVKLAGEKMHETTINELEEINERFQIAIEAENYYSALKVDESFHQVIIDAADNPYIKHMIGFLQAHVRRHFFHNAIVLTETSIADHQALIKHFKNNQLDQAVQVMESNWLRTLDLL